MTDDTILGSAPSGTDPGPDRVVPGAERAERDGAGTAGEEPEPLDYEPPGDVDTARHLGDLYALIALGFERPGEELQAAVDAGAYCNDLVESASAIDDDLSDLALAVGTRVRDAADLHPQWASLFGVEEGVTVSPYEVTYVPGPLMTNVREIADLAGFYEAFGLTVADGQNDRRDHLCFELEFLAHLSLREAVLRADGDEEGLAVVGDARRQFVEDHLGRWYWRFADEVSQRDDGFYAALADLLAGLVETEVDRLDVDPDWVPDDPAVTEWTEDVFGDSGRGCGGCGADATGAEPAAGSPGRSPSVDGTGGPPRPDASDPDDA